MGQAPKKPFPPGPYRDLFLASVTGDEFEMVRRPDENDLRWRNNSQVMRSAYKRDFGIVTTERTEGNKKIITVVRGSDNPLPGAKKKIPGAPSVKPEEAAKLKGAEHHDRFLTAKTGDKIVVNRANEQDAKQFQGSIHTLKSKYRLKHGIDFKFEQFDNHAVLTILRGTDNPLPEDQRRRRGTPANARFKDRQPGEVKTIYEAPPKPVEPAKPAAPVAAMREDESAFWRDLFKTSLTSAPSADPTHHAAVAKAGVEAYRARFVPA